MGDESDAPSFARATASYECEDDQFLVSNRNYDRQYASFYFARYNALVEVMKQRVELKWPTIPCEFG